MAICTWHRSCTLFQLFCHSDGLGTVTDHSKLFHGQVFQNDLILKITRTTTAKWLACMIYIFPVQQLLPSSWLHKIYCQNDSGSMCSVHCLQQQVPVLMILTVAKWDQGLLTVAKCMLYISASFICSSCPPPEPLPYHGLTSPAWCMKYRFSCKSLV